MTCNKNEWNHITEKKAWMTTLLQNSVSDVTLYLPVHSINYWISKIAKIPYVYGRKWV